MRCRSVVTNTVPTAPFRGAGRPEATLVLERLIDLAAARLDIDRVKLRQKNLITRKKLPYRTASGLLYDSGDFTGNMKRMVEAADWKGFAGAAARVQAQRQTARHRHLELCRDAGRHPARARRGHGAAGRQGRTRGRHAIDRPGPRDHVRTGDGGPARRASGGHQVHRRRHPAGRIRQRHALRPLDAARRHADGAGVGRRGGAGEVGGGEGAGRAGGRDRFHRRPVRHAEEQPPSDDLRCGAGARRQSLPRPGENAALESDLHRPHPRLPHRLRDLRGRDRSRHRRVAVSATARSTTPARRSIR